jgi:hypothetical protein
MDVKICGKKSNRKEMMMMMIMQLCERCIEKLLKPNLQNIKSV